MDPRSPKARPGAPTFFLIPGTRCFRMSASVFGPAVHSSFEGAAVHAGQSGCDLVGKERVVPGGDEKVRDAPDVFFGGHPMMVVKAGEVDGE